MSAAGARSAGPVLYFLWDNFTNATVHWTVDSLLCSCVFDMWLGSSCDGQGSLCTPGLCQEPKICRSDGQSYTCSCPDGFAGDDCQELVQVPCNDLTCRSKWMSHFVFDAILLLLHQLVAPVKGSNPSCNKLLKGLLLYCCWHDQWLAASQSYKRQLIGINCRYCSTFCFVFFEPELECLGVY